MGHSGYRGGPGSSSAARPLLTSLCASPGHQFWPDTTTLRDARRFRALPASAGLTDADLLALAAEHDARLATFDRRIEPADVVGGQRALRVLPMATP